MQKSEAVVYLVPLPVTDGLNNTLSADVIGITSQLRLYFVENARTARRFLRSLHANLILEEITFSEIDKHTGPDTGLFKSLLRQGLSVGIMSESGCPGIADPGADLVAVAQAMNVKVVPLTGPNSVILALMASGLNGQSFSFRGYLPVKEPLRSQKIKELEQFSGREQQTQIFIETPYRNDNLFADLLKNCAGQTRICVASDITSANSMIRTKTVDDWKKSRLTIGKVPCVFLMLA